MGAATLGQRIAELRNQKGLSQKQLGSACGVAYQTVARWEHDDVLPDLGNIIALAKELGTDLNWLVFGDQAVRLTAEDVRELKARLEDISRAAGDALVIFKKSELQNWPEEGAQADRKLIESAGRALGDISGRIMIIENRARGAWRITMGVAPKLEQPKPKKK